MRSSLMRFRTRGSFPPPSFPKQSRWGRDVRSRNTVSPMAVRSQSAALNFGNEGEMEQASALSPPFCGFAALREPIPLPGRCRSDTQILGQPADHAHDARLGDVASFKRALAKTQREEAVHCALTRHHAPQSVHGGCASAEGSCWFATVPPRPRSY